MSDFFMGLKKANRVSWASGPNLCQVKHFREEDCPSKVGRGLQHHLQSQGMHSYKFLAIWKCPPKFNLNKNWLVVAGDESKEAGEQEHREKSVLEAVFPCRSAIPPNPYDSSDLDQSYDDNLTPVIRTTPIEDEAVEVSVHLTPSQTICSKSPDTCLPNSPPSSVKIVASQKLPANGKSLPQSLSTFQNPRKPLSNSPFSVRCPSNVQSTPPNFSRCQNLKGSSCASPYQAKIFPEQPANRNHGPNYGTISENQNIPQLKSQVSGMPPAHNPVTQKIPGFEGDLTVAIATAVAALAKSQEQGSLIDTNLLVRLLLKPEEIPKLMNERGMATNAKTGAATGDSLIAAMSRPVDLLVPLPRTKPDKVIIKPINEYQAPHAGSGPIFGPTPMAKSVPLTMTRPETSVKSNLVNEQGAPHVETANNRQSKSPAHPTSDLNLEKIKKLINKYGVQPDHVGGNPLVNSELVSKYDAVLSSADHPATLQPKLSLSPNVGHTPAPRHMDINYCKSLIKQHGTNCESVVDERLQNTNPRGPGLLKNQKPIQRSLTHCIFFNKPMGCRNGSSCPFLHEISGQKRSGGMLEVLDSKRMK